MNLRKCCVSIWRKQIRRIEDVELVEDVGKAVCFMVF